MCLPWGMNKKNVAQLQRGKERHPARRDAGEGWDFWMQRHGVVWAGWPWGRWTPGSQPHRAPAAAPVPQLGVGGGKRCCNGNGEIQVQHHRGIQCNQRCTWHQAQLPSLSLPWVLMCQPAHTDASYSTAPQLCKKSMLYLWQINTWIKMPHILIYCHLKVLLRILYQTLCQSTGGSSAPMAASPSAGAGSAPSRSSTRHGMMRSAASSPGRHCPGLAKACAVRHFTTSKKT